jgi:hypothetical protein
LLLLLLKLLINLKKISLLLEKNYKFDLKGKIKNYKNFEKKAKEKNKKIKSRRTELKSILG